MITVQENEKLYYLLFPDEKPDDDTEKPQSEDAE